MKIVLATIIATALFGLTVSSTPARAQSKDDAKEAKEDKKPAAVEEAKAPNSSQTEEKSVTN